MKNSEMKTDESKHCGLITSELVDEMRRTSFAREAQDNVTDEEALGLHIAQYFRWKGDAIIRTLCSALEDANFHTERREILKMCPWAFPENKEAEIKKAEIKKAEIKKAEIKNFT